MKPGVVAAICAMIFNVSVGLVLVLGWPFTSLKTSTSSWFPFGFPACPSVTVAAELVQAIVLVSFV